MIQMKSMAGQGKKDNLKTQTRQRKKSCKSRHPNGDEVSNFEIVFICRKWSGNPKSTDGEMEELRFFACDEIDLSEISPPIRPVVKAYIMKETP